MIQYKYLKRHLLPVLKKGDVVVMDNLSSHKGENVETLLASKGATALYLPVPDTPTNLTAVPLETPMPQALISYLDEEFLI